MRNIIGLKDYLAILFSTVAFLISIYALVFHTRGLLATPQSISYERPNGGKFRTDSTVLTILTEFVLINVGSQDMVLSGFGLYRYNSGQESSTCVFPKKDDPSVVRTTQVEIVEAGKAIRIKATFPRLQVRDGNNSLCLVSMITDFSGRDENVSFVIGYIQMHYENQKWDVIRIDPALVTRSVVDRSAVLVRSPF